MNSNPRPRPSFVLLSTLALFIFAASGFAQKDWLPIAPADLQATTATVEPGADAEAIFWEVRVDDSSADGLSLRHYVRIKIFTDRGREDFAKHDVPFLKGTRIKDFEARVTKPDGTSTIVPEDDVIEREIVKASGFKVKAKTIAFPNLEKGAILEYRYREVIEDGNANMRLTFQLDIPVRRVTYYVKPFQGDSSMAYFPFNMGDAKFVKDKNGFSKAELTNVPSLRTEPYMLPEDEVKAWMLIYYTQVVPKNADQYWATLSGALYSGNKSYLKFNDDIKAAAQTAISGAATDDEKLKRLYEFVKTKIKNTTFAVDATDEQKKQAAKNKSASDTFENKLGTSSDIDQLFGAMARSVGYDARVAYSGDRSEMFFKPYVPNFREMLGSSSIAVKIGDGWRFFSPAGYYTEYGMLSWSEEAQVALVPDPDSLLWINIPLSPAERSMEKRSGTFKLAEDGTLTGEGRVEFTGHQAYSRKLLNRGESQAEREQRLKDYVHGAIMPGAEIESFTIENVDEPEKPLIYTFKVKVPGYALKTGRRLFFQPDVFERSSQPRFTSNERKYDVYFNYPFSENDKLTIDLPTGYTLENADAPAYIADNDGIGKHAVAMAVTKEGKLIYQREFSFGNKNRIRFPAKAYPAVKQLFESFNKAATHQLTLRSGAAAATTSSVKP